LRDLWQEPEQFPDPEEVRWWEVWLARFEPGRSIRNTKAVALRVSPQEIAVSTGPGSTLRAIAEAQGWPMAPGLLGFPENVVALVRTSATELGTILSTSAVPSELHRARVTSEIFSVTPLDQNQFVADLAGRIKAADPEAGGVCVLDTGLMSGHPLLRSSVDRTLSALDGVRPGDEHGHGTSMAGLALFANLNRDLLGNGLVPLRHRIESVKIIRQGVDTDNDPEMYGVITAAAAAAVETEESRRRVFSMAVTVDDPAGSDGRPTSYSAAFDALAFGTDIARSDDGIELLGQPDPHAGRLFVVSGGNIRDDYHVNHLDVCDLSRVQNPAQAWNVLTVGAYTELVTPPADPMFAGWHTVAEAGELSPYSRSSTTFGRSCPVKPDIVLEGGNLLADPGGTHFDEHDDLALVTTSNAHSACSPRRTRRARPPLRPPGSLRSRWSATRSCGRRRCAVCSSTRPSGRQP
jgi:hypothetical protein